MATSSGSASRETDRRVSAPVRTIAVTFDGGPALQAVVQDVLDGSADLAFVSGLSEDERRRVLGSAEVMLSWNIGRELEPGTFAAAERLRLLQLLSAGVDHVPFGDIPASITVASNVGAYAEPMAEHVLAMALALAKHLPQRHAELAHGEFKQWIHNRMIDGSVCGILGFGGIGKATGRRFRALGARIYAVNTTGSTDEPVDFVGTLHDLDTVLEASDVLVIALPLTKETRGLIGRRELSVMKPDAILVNVARGAIVEEEALYEHLRSHGDFAAAIDAWWQEPFGGGDFRIDEPFFELPNLLGSPHNSAIVPGIEAQAVRRAAENVLQYLQGKPVSGVVRREDYQG
jgi:phosphoglycerate dehydrogenase-like enzyme